MKRYTDICVKLIRDIEYRGVVHKKDHIFRLNHMDDIKGEKIYICSGHGTYMELIVDIDAEVCQERYDDWYWVRIDNDWMPAVKDEKAAGGWTNLDTWEDFHGEVEEFVKIDPPAPKKGKRDETKTRP